MRVRLGRFAKARWRGLKRAYRRHVFPHRRAMVVVLLVLAGGGLVLATLPARHSERSPGPGVARPVAAPAEPVVPPERPVQPAKPIEEAALRPPPPLPPPTAAKPAWLRFAVPAPPTGHRPLVAIVLDDLGLDRARTAEAI